MFYIITLLILIKILKQFGMKYFFITLVKTMCKIAFSRNVSYFKAWIFHNCRLVAIFNETGFAQKNVVMQNINFYTQLFKKKSVVIYF